MQLEDYFEFMAPDDIRVKGTHVGIETILTDYLELGLFAEQIAVRYPTLSVEQVYATLTYYWRNERSGRCLPADDRPRNRRTAPRAGPAPITGRSAIA